MEIAIYDVIEEFAPRAPDPDGGRTYRRLMTSLKAAPDVLGWGEPAVLQARAAARVARADAASGDPAMAFGPSCERTGEWKSARLADRQRPRCRTISALHLQ